MLRSREPLHRRAFPYVAVLCLAAGALAAALYAYPPLILVFRGLHSVSPYCSLADAMRDSRVGVAQEARAHELAAAARRLEARDGLELWSTPAGDWWVPESGPMMISTLLAQQERDIYGAAEWGVQPGDTVLDCGAHVGVFTRKALDSGAARVIAIEPFPPAVACLRLNFANEIAAGRVVVVPEGVWDETGMLPLFDNGNGGAANSLVLGTITRSVEVPVTTIDELAERLGLERVDFLKMDIKSATVRALHGAAATLERDRPLLALSTEESEDAGAVFASVTGLRAGYDARQGPCLIMADRIYTDVLFFR